MNIHAHYCDNIIRHANDQYSLIGIYSNVYPLPTAQHTIGQLNINIEIEANEALFQQPLRISIELNQQPILQGDMPTPPIQTGISLVQPQLNNLPVHTGDKLTVRLYRAEQTIWQSQPLVFKQAA
nr:MAG TPA: hypothetical protein [Bacteriophage sp.]